MLQKYIQYLRFIGLGKGRIFLHILIHVLDGVREFVVNIFAVSFYISCLQEGKMGYDTINLRNDAEFRTRIAKGVYWVPFHSLGKSRYQNETLEKMNRETPSVFGSEVHLNVYEAIQLFQMIRCFEECNERVEKEFEQIRWRLHKSGKYAYETNQGDCADACAWLNYIVGDLYPEKGYLEWILADGSSHIVNYFYLDGFYYLVDMDALTQKNAVSSPAETGKKADYLEARLSGGACIQAKSLEDFIAYQREAVFCGEVVNYLRKEAADEVPPNCIFHEKKMLIYLELGSSQVLTMTDFHYESRKWKKSMKLPAGYVLE